MLEKNNDKQIVENEIIALEKIQKQCYEKDEIDAIQLAIDIFKLELELDAKKHE